MSWSLADTVCSIPERFEEQARRSPAKVAIAGTDWEPTYAELDAAANRIAAVLTARGVLAGMRVALLMRQDAPLIAAKLAVLKTGAIAVVLNPSDPPARLGRSRAKTTPTLLISDSESQELALAAGFSRDGLVVLPDRPEDAPHPAPGIALDPDEVAQLMCTSGSTGEPVAVMQSHRNMLHNVLRHSNGLGLREDDRIVLLASPSGGQGAGTVWTALCNGATLCPFPVLERGMTGLERWLNELEVTVFVSSASLFRHFLATLTAGATLPGVRLVRLGSERALASDYEGWRRHFSPRCVFANTYSSSETGAITQFVILDEAQLSSGRLPAGRPAEGIEILVHREDGDAPCGETGEILVRSRYNSPGYWGESQLTASRFAEEADGFKLFRTGDLGYRDEDGLLTVLGRVDDLVKIRGNRVSLAEVETSLSALEGVREAAVLAEERPNGDTRMAAYVAHGSSPAPSTADLRRELSGTLPDHALPSSFEYMEELPLTPHGKVDRRRLAQAGPPEPTAAVSPIATSPVGPPPIGETEELIAAIWERVLDRSDFGRGYDFFGFGGDSLAAAEVAVGIEDALGVEVGMRAFAREPTVAGLARLVEQLRAAAAGEGETPLVKAPPHSPQPASFAQERIWRHSQVPEEAAGWVVAASSTITGPLDEEVLRACLDHLMRRHPAAMRTRFPERDGEVLQVIEPPIPLELPLHDFSAKPDPHESAAALMRELVAEPFDLERGPLLRMELVRLGEGVHQLLRICHHITCDAQSWKILFAELALLYEAAVQGEPPPLSDELPYSYGDVAARQREGMRPGGPLHRATLDRWRDLRAERATAPPFRRPVRVEDASPQDGTIRWGLPPSVTAGLAVLGREAGVTYYMVRMALYAALLAAETGDRELLFGTYVTTRRQPEILGMFGCFTQAAAVRLSAPVDATVDGWLRQVRSAVLDVNEHTELPYETLMEELGREGVNVPGIETVFSLAEVRPPLRFAGLELGVAERSKDHYMPAGFVFQVNRLLELDDCRVDFDANIYDPVLVRGFVARYQRLATELCGDRDRPLSELVERSAARPAISAPARAGMLRRWLGREA
jgi:amino acid adenylation domain-containing protein